ncbi:nucleoside-diphosphate sugar epimerase/dehydratase [Jeotgalibacillus sp. ET6]|uniref:polysaccharide biosynthesis protein n=1 Tax=Jeotgalibacillus sp. ET6 TaxID=3037260 RepID=UPI00241848FF|nr:nucleoside-diphosphate sugar epimerase/dehydratase [Jeotgalibacillus sp. ET6]MDG5471715.1 nucleoside-diphosphate sugar epimerase/dehydratase [Jeotgalibacillus sp. ET6]
MKRNKRILFSSLTDIFIIFASVAGSCYLLLGPYFSDFLLEAVYLTLLYSLTFIGAFLYFNVYKNFWRYVSHYEFYLISKTAILSILVCWSAQVLLEKINGYAIPFALFLLSWVFIVCGVSFIRIFTKIRYSLRETGNENGRRTLIIGAGNAGRLVLNELRKSHNSPLYPVAFIDDALDKLDAEISGIPIVGSRHDIHKVIKEYAIETVIIAIPSASGPEISAIVTICKDHRIDVKILPRINDIINGRIATTIREVKVEDLLGRAPIKLDLDLIASYLTDKVVLVSGAGGSIGSELCRQIAQFSPSTLLLLGHGENSIYLIERELRSRFPQLQIEPIIGDVQDRKRIQRVFRDFHPQVIFHAAAHKHVPLMEYNPTEAIKNNVFGTRIMAECAHESGAEKFVLVSTDKAVNPTSVMGVTKRIAELYIQHINSFSSTRFAAVRFGNVLGSRGSVIPLFKQQILEGGPITVTHPDMTRYFMTIPEAVQLVIQAGGLSTGGETFVLDMGEPVKISDLARNLITLSGLTPGKDIEIKYSGMRPGEKLYEELLSAEEGNRSSKHELIFIAQPVEIENYNMPEKIQRLKDLIKNNEKEEQTEDLKKCLKEIVPSYLLSGDENGQ